MKYKQSNLNIQHFKELPLSDKILNRLSEQNIVRPTNIQKSAIPTILTQKDTIALAETGSGKTLSYLLPLIILLESKKIERGLVLLPNRELALQVYEIMKGLSYEIAADVLLVIGGKKMEAQEKGLKRTPKIIIATPGRLYDHLLKNKQLLTGVSYLVVDEAERMLDSGFAPQLQNIQRCLRGDVQVLFFSASLSPSVEKIVQIFMSGQPILIKQDGFDRPVQNLKQEVHYLQSEQKNDHLLDLVNKTKGQMLIFTMNQENCEKIYQYLVEYGVDITYIHGGLSQGARNRSIQSFKDQSAKVLVTTDMLARGLDFDSIEHVISYDLPLDSADYLHRIGRTARAGQAGRATVLVTPKNEKLYLKIKKYLNKAIEVKIDQKFQFPSSKTNNKISQPIRRKK